MVVCVPSVEQQTSRSNMKYLTVSVAVVLTRAIVTAAHGGVTSWTVGSTTYPGWQPYLSRTFLSSIPTYSTPHSCHLPSAVGQDTVGRPYSSYDPILNAVSPTMHCNNDGNNGPIPESITLAAGSDLTAHWYASHFSRLRDNRVDWIIIRTQWTHA